MVETVVKGGTSEVEVPTSVPRDFMPMSPKMVASACPPITN
jgi:hypothetical protein